MTFSTLVLSAVLCAAPPTPTPTPAGSTIEVIEAGQPSRTLSLRSLQPAEFTSPDVQYRGPQAFRGVALDKVLDAAKPSYGADLAVLHFKNGMAVPLPFRKLALLKQLGAFVALEVKVDAAWTTTFPRVAKLGAEERDRRPIVFEGNKLVVPAGWHPSLPEAAAADASPWLYVDSLTRIEFAKSEVWNAQFSVRSEDATVKQGERLFLARCVFCHGVKKAGASWGWDFVVPVPMFQHRTPKSLWLHVKSRPADAPETGLMMPAFRDVTEPEGAALWKWMEAVAR